MNMETSRLGPEERQAEVRRLTLLAAGEILRRRRRARLSRSALAKRLGMTMAHLAALEEGTADPTVSELERIADQLRCTVADLLPPVRRNAAAFAELFEAASMPVQRAIYEMLLTATTPTKTDGSTRP